VSLFNSNVGIYQIHNNDSWYNFGFRLGVWILFQERHGPGRRHVPAGDVPVRS
jgi:hypothetical protein